MTGDRSDTLRPERRFSIRLWCAGGAALAVALLLGALLGGSPEPLLASLAPLFDAVLALGTALHHEGGAWFAAVRLPVLAIVASAVFVGRRRGAGEDAAAPLLGALAVAYCAQSYLAGGDLGVAIALYALAVGLCLWRRAAVPEIAGPSPHAWALLAGLVALYLVAVLYALDVTPEVHYDEDVYLVAARMARGEVPPGQIEFARSMRGVYPYERFQAHFIPLGLHSAAIPLFPRGVIATRLVSVSAGALALLVAATALRRHFGTRAVAWMLVLAAFSPLVHGYTRVALYVPITIAHGALALAAFLRFRERRDRASSVVLGLVLGCTLFLYQLSWFVPVLVVLATLATPDLLRAEGFVRRAALTAGVAALVTLPGVWWQWDGMGVVARQSLWKGVWKESGVGLRGPVLVTAIDILMPESVDVDDVPGILASLDESGIRAGAHYTQHGRTVLRVSGTREAVQAILAEHDAAGGTVLADTRVRRSVTQRLAAQLDLLLRSPHFEIKGVVTDVPVITALVAPLLVLGVAEGLRRARAPAVRVTIVWALVGGLLPAIVASSGPRRSVLALPTVLLLAGLPLAVAGDALRRALPRGRLVAGLAGAVWLVLAGSLGLHHYFAHWTRSTGFHRHLPSELQLVEALRALPADEPVFLPRGLDGLAPRIRHSDPAAIRGEDRITPVRHSTPRMVRATSCRRDVPFTWITDDDRASTHLLDTLESDFEVRVEWRPGYRLLRIVALRPDGCRGTGPRSTGSG